jgi:CelD/BcsL family acetyltransferase involved in cellulose biosynthesis
MAVSVTSQSNPYVDKLIVDTEANATAEFNVLTGAATIYIVDIDNSNNTGSAAYAKLWNNTNPSVGTTEPDFILKAPKGVRQVVTISSGSNFATGLSFACVTGAETANQTNPTNKVTMRVMAE